MEEKTINQIIEEVAYAICMEYCEYPESGIEEEELYEICAKCPLNKL